MCIYGITVLGLFGTCNGSKWREELLTKLDKEITYFNPVVDDWNEEAQAEDKHKKSDTFILLTLTPEMKGFYNKAQLKGIKKIIKDIEAIGVNYIYDNLDDVANFINTYSRMMYGYRYDIKDALHK